MIVIRTVHLSNRTSIEYATIGNVPAIGHRHSLPSSATNSYVTDLRNILDESEVAQRKAFLRSFVKKIVVEKEEVKLYYNLPVPPDGRKTDTVRVLPIDTPSGEEGTRTPTPCST